MQASCGTLISTSTLKEGLCGQVPAFFPVETASAPASGRLNQEMEWLHYMEILRSSEDYLETMLMLQQQRGYIRSIDIAEHLSVTKPSVSYAVKRLRENGYLTMDKGGLITLTDRGMAIAAEMLDRHKTLTAFLIDLGVDAKTAEEDACKIEHDISQQTFDAICHHARGHINEQ